MSLIKRFRGGRLLAGLLTLVLVLPAMISVGFTQAAWADEPAAGAQGDTHITELSFRIERYAFGKKIDGIQLSGQTSNVFPTNWQITQQGMNDTDWKLAKGTFTNEAKYRLKVFFSAKPGYDFDGLTKDKITLVDMGSAFEYDPREKSATFNLPAIPANRTLSFDTDGGTPIDSVTKPENTKIDLSAYVPTKEGFTFEGWYSEKALTNKITEITLGQDMTVYAKWAQAAAPAPGGDNPQTSNPSNPQNPQASNPDTRVNPGNDQANGKKKGSESGNKNARMAKNKGMNPQLEKTGANSGMLLTIAAMLTSAGIALTLRGRIKEN